MRFGDDYSGVFIRGDNALGFAHELGCVVKQLGFAPGLRKLLQHLRSCDDTAGPPEGLQRLKPFEECVLPNQRDLVRENERLRAHAAELEERLREMSARYGVFETPNNASEKG